MKEADTFEELTRLLVRLLPEWLAMTVSSKEICIARLRYYDSHAPEVYLDLRLVPVATRASILEARGRNGLFYLWGSGEESGHEAEVDSEKAAAAAGVRAELESCYRGIEAKMREGEDAAMTGLRSALQLAAKILNRRGWSAVSGVSTDFVLIPSDGSQHFADESDDLFGSLPWNRVASLQAAGLLGTPDRWDDRPGFEVAPEDPDTERQRVMDHIAALSPDLVTAYWKGQLEAMALGKDNDMQHLNCTAGHPASMFAESCKEPAVELMKLAVGWADMREFDVDDEDVAEPTPVEEVLHEILNEVIDLGHSSPELETLLRRYVKVSCATNEGCQLWGSTPYKAARALATLFDDYPEADMAGNNRLLNPEHYS